ncbi:nuclear transport factor 2 family protein [Pseudooceanicola sp.]|uniref:nuclear transport factor 2 family protein n=1 Tax=Pseudooceanicola sp. TaxID=1914328 RepID=UPI0035C7450E
MPEDPEVTTSGDCGNSPKNARAQDIALALMGAGTLDSDLLAENAVWERPGGAVTGRKAILRALQRAKAPVRIEVDQVVTHGKSGSVSGRYVLAEGEERLFCHVLRFTTATMREVAQMVSFEHRVKAR